MEERQETAKKKENKRQIRRIIEEQRERKQLRVGKIIYKRKNLLYTWLYGIRL